MSEHDETTEYQLIEARRSKHEAVLSSGGYPHRFDRTDLAADLHSRFSDLEPAAVTDERVSVAGRLMLHRSFGKLQFGTLQDVSGTIQLFVDRKTAGQDLAEKFATFDLCDWVGAGGFRMLWRWSPSASPPEAVTRPSSPFTPASEPA